MKNQGVEREKREKKNVHRRPTTHLSLTRVKPPYRGQLSAFNIVVGDDI